MEISGRERETEREKCGMFRRGFGVSVQGFHVSGGREGCLGAVGVRAGEGGGYLREGWVTAGGGRMSEHGKGECLGEECVKAGEGRVCVGIGFQSCRERESLFGLHIHIIFHNW